MIRVAALSLCLFWSCLLQAGGAAAFVQEHPRPGQKPSRWWKVSVAALVAASAADAWSSYQRPEANPLLRNQGGRFAARGISLKAAITGGSMAAQWMLLRKNPSHGRAAAAANFVMGGAFAGAVIHNRRLAAAER